MCGFRCQLPLVSIATSKGEEEEMRVLCDALFVLGKRESRKRWRRRAWDPPVVGFRNRGSGCSPKRQEEEEERKWRPGIPPSKNAPGATNASLAIKTVTSLGTAPVRGGAPLPSARPSVGCTPSGSALVGGGRASCSCPGPPRTPGGISTAAPLWCGRLLLPSFSFIFFLFLEGMNDCKWEVFLACLLFPTMSVQLSCSKWVFRFDFGTSASHTSFAGSEFSCFYWTLFTKKRGLFLSLVFWGMLEDVFRTSFLSLFFNLTCLSLVRILCLLNCIWFAFFKFALDVKISSFLLHLPSVLFNKICLFYRTDFLKFASKFAAKKCQFSLLPKYNFSSLSYGF